MSGLPGMSALWESVAEAAPMKTAPHEQLGFGVLAPDPAHYQPALFRGQYVGGLVVHRKNIHGIRRQRSSLLHADRARRPAFRL